MSVPYLNMLIKPASGLCNMKCIYCFYADETAARRTADFGIMKEAAAEILVEKALDEAVRGCTFMFQGGEPLLAGLGFFERFAGFAEKHNRKRIPVSYSIQTNGYALTDEWAAFFARHRFLVGLSYDGLDDIHDAFRPDRQGRGTSSRVKSAVRILNSHGVPFNILTVVTSELAGKIRKIYPQYKNAGIRWQQYIPCLDPLPDAERDTAAENESRSVSGSPYLTAGAYGLFLKQLFDMWYDDIEKGKDIHIRYFENLAAMCAGYPPESCGMSGSCVLQYVVEADGSVYPCDFYALDRWRLGSIVTDSFDSIRDSFDGSGFAGISEHLHAKCGTCRWRFLCRGGCRRDRRDGGTGLNRFCSAYRTFFEHAYPRLQKLALRVKKAGTA